MNGKEGRAVSTVLRLSVGDVLELKKPHPCGSHRFTVLRVGSEVRIKCEGCAHDMTLDRIKLERAVRRLYPVSAEHANS